MPVGASMGFAQMNNILTSLSVTLREIMNDISNTNLSVNGQGAGLAYMQSIGYSNAANPANPNNKSDAQLALDMLSYLNTVAAVYFGTVAQTPAFNFHQQLSMLWSAQVA
jgi:hypothetical protein